VCTTEDKTVRFFDIRKASAVTPIDMIEFASPINSMHFDGLRLAVATSTGLYIHADGLSSKSISVPHATCVSFTTRSPTIVAGYMDYHVAVMDFNPRGRKRKNL